MVDAAFVKVHLEDDARRRRAVAAPGDPRERRRRGVAAPRDLRDGRPARRAVDELKAPVRARRGDLTLTLGRERREVRGRPAPEAAAVRPRRFLWGDL